ncbi:MAG: tRNA cytidylyltransferase [Planctomycetes bacterium]|nr:tRNA cytidylyltransferase [Planctomycetota bacterium]
MRRPSIAQCPIALAEVARSVARRLANSGHRAWIVGGSVRDLALGRAPEDVDMTSAATPDEVEPLFEHVVPLGRAFGTLQLLVDGVEVEHTTFRSETGYADSRRPTSIAFGRTLEEDAARRDFTCNALYLDPLTDEVADPTGGLADLERGVLRTVGEPRERFREDGLRLVRMARFAAALRLEIEPATWEAARASHAALVGVSVERALVEFERMFAAPGGPRAVELLRGAGLLELLLPGQGGLHGPELAPESAQAIRAAALEVLEPAPGVALGLAVLLDPDPTGHSGPSETSDPTALAQPGEHGGSARSAGSRGLAGLHRSSNAPSSSATGPASTAEAALERLRPSRELRRTVEGLWRLRREFESLAASEAAPRSRKARTLREPLADDALRVAVAFRIALGRAREPLDALGAWKRALGADELHPKPLCSPDDLARAGVPRDARFGATLAALEDAQLDGSVTTREQALAWLAERVKSL